MVEEAWIAKDMTILSEWNQTRIDRFHVEPPRALAYPDSLHFQMVIILRKFTGMITILPWRDLLSEKAYSR